MKISIVVPTLNSEQFLEQCLSSIFCQSYRDFEVTIVDGYSTDGTHRIVNRYRSRFSNIHLCYVKPDGQSDAINKGMAISYGDVVTYLCSDDTYEEGCFETIVKHFKLYPDVQWVYGRTKIIDGDSMEVRGIITKGKELLQPRYRYGTLKCVDYIAQPSVFMRKSLYEHIGQFNTKLRYVMDYEFWLRAGKVYKPMFIDSHLANWRKHDGSTSVKEYKEEARQAFEVQMRYSEWWLRPIQFGIYLGTMGLYKIMR